MPEPSNISKRDSGAVGVGREKCEGGYQEDEL